MKKWIVFYYKRHNFISNKIIFANDSAQAIKKANVKNIVDLKLV